jgi:hypothetical protein
MPADHKTERLLRQYEADVLDRHHQTFAIWNRDRPVATYAALAQFDCYAILALFLPDTISGVGTTQIVKGTEEGLSQAIRWLHAGNPQYDLVPTGDKAIIGEAGDYCAFAAKYVDIADMHKMYGRGQVDIEVDEGQRKVRFVTPVNRPPAAALIPMAEQAYRIGRLPIVKNPTTMAAVGKAVHQTMKAAQYHYAGGRIILDDVSVANSQCILDQLALAIPAEPILLDESAELSGFTVQEFTDYFEALRRWSFCCTFLFMSSLLEQGKQQWECVPTQVIERKQFLESIGMLSGLPPDKIEAITLRLTYDRHTASPEVFQQPLFCGPSVVAWSVQVAQSSKYLRNMLKLMSKTKALQDYTATLIGGRERAMLREVGDLLSSRGGCSYRLLTGLKSGEKTGEVDLLAYNLKFFDEVLLIEGKAVLGVDEINEVDAATKQMREGQVELQRVEEILGEMPDQEKGQLFKFVNWKTAKRYFGVVVAADAEPNDLYDHSKYPGISLQTIKARLRENHFASPQKFWRACTQRGWLQDLKQYRESYRPIPVGEVTYDLPVLVEPREQAEARRTAAAERAIRPEEKDRAGRRLGRKRK